MKKNILIALTVLFTGIASAQTGLDSVIVEKYYVSDENDSIGSSGILPVGSVTYRFYADMDSGYNLQVVYGSPTHLLKFTTTTSFFNNNDFGGVLPAYSSGNAKKNSVMLDSWLTMGAACNGFWGILKTEDDGLTNFVNSDGLIQNNNPFAGVPVNEKDGMLAGTVTPASLLGNFNYDVFGDGTLDSDSLGIDNGSWYVLGGVTGPTKNNRVLFAQVTTNGTLQYELNLLLGKDLGNGNSLSEKYVAKDPVSAEMSGEKYKLSGEIVPPEVSRVNKINELNTAESSLKVFPSPAEDFIWAKLTLPSRSSSVSLKLININGQQVYSGMLEPGTSERLEKINLAGLAPGIYALSVTTDKATLIQRFIKK